MAPDYRGRFAPTPSGPLHSGSLLTAVASYLDARQAGGTWLLRIEDLDPPREIPGAADIILRQLEDHGLAWDGPVQYQSQRQAAYAAALDQLHAQGMAFYCTLSRRQLAERGGHHPGPAVATSPGPNRAVRLAVPETTLHFDDLLQGPQQSRLSTEDGAFVIRRRDGFYAYQLACALDDADSGITHVLRGIDLLESTFRQLWVLDCLSRPRPQYGHLPVLVDASGEKLSKSAGAAALGNDHRDNLFRLLSLLGLAPPPPLRHERCDAQLAWATTHWQRNALAGHRALRD
ncbi:tRNA glutamyl-Q(34) synthetase GluQRS [Isoalcanivorax indicus]|uniref:tRNA glutamyl-Q(34) synthetase GluQRS n=1 Tax=Isoalcanivorax indicus TaxID=2202653 RepID=UPI000DB902CB|nr:tRNA glutamyl-Q(34) synthetase GluQRS [Isoalcanivorax indicus]